MRLSIVVPVYNVEKYLAKCVDSLLDQDIDGKEYEILLIDDHSADSSPDIARTYAETHPNVRTIAFGVNGGLSVARNRGLDEARGDYVMFIDSDDYLMPHVLPGLLRTAEEDRLDILAFDYVKVDEHGNEIPYDGPRSKVDFDGVLSGTDYILNNEPAYMVPLHLFRRIFLLERGLRMMPGKKHEDEDFVPRAIALAGRVRYVPMFAYCYLQREGSVTQAYDSRNMKDMADCLSSLHRFAHSPAVTDPRVTAKFDERIWNILSWIIKENYSKGYMDEYEYLKYLKHVGLMHLLNPDGKFRLFLREYATWSYCAWRRRGQRRGQKKRN